MTHAVPSFILDNLRDLVSNELGLNFPPARSADLQRGLVSAARELKLHGVDELALWLRSASSPARSALLARHLTVGETYFYRHRSLFDALEERILPDLIRARTPARKRLRLWSAACCTGEEAYSLAIAVYRALPDLSDWDVSILGTDANTRFLQKAEKGVFGVWSFRETPPAFRERYFSRCAGDQWQIRPEIRRLVTFSQTNLADELSPDSPFRGCDIIFCRNALIYFTPEQATRLIARLANCLPEGGWLMTAPSETALAALPTLAPVQFPGAMAFRKTSRRSAPAPASAVNPPSETSVDTAPLIRAFSWPTDSTPAQPAINLPEPSPAHSTHPQHTAATHDHAASLALAARTSANQRRFPEALAHCDELVALNKCDASAHYLRAGILAEADAPDAAIEALKRVLYLEPDFILAHFALGNLYRLNGDSNRAARHFAHALDLARQQPPDQLVPASDGLTAGQLAQTLAVMHEPPSFR